MAKRSQRAAWYHAVRAHGALLDLMDRELMSDCGVPLVWYDVMVELMSAPDRALRMNELAERVLLSRSWITRRVSQLEAAGLVERRRADGDQRGVVAALTPYGCERFTAMEESHAASIERHFSRYLDDSDSAVIAQAFARIADHARAELGASPERLSVLRRAGEAPA